MRSIAIIGAGQAGGWVAKTLRDLDFAGDIVLIGDEPYPPYERPPLSKGILLETQTPESTYLWTALRLKELGVSLKCGCRATAVDRKSRTVLLSNGSTIPYDRLVLTTGSRARRLMATGADLSGIHYMRSIDDALAISKSLSPGTRLLVVGGGWIGLEVAAAARQRDIDVVLVEATDRLCSRALPTDVARYVQRHHENRGVRILLNTSVARFGGDGCIEFAELSNGSIVVADVAVIGVGAIPNSDIALDADLECKNGIVVDEFGRTSDELIYAAGDVSNQPDGHGKRVRLESWSNAQNQAIAVAKAILGANSPYRDIPYFWSEQYDIKLQMLGTFSDYDSVVLRGDQDSQPMFFYLTDNKITAAAAVNRAQDLAVARRLMQRSLAVDPGQLRTVASLRDLLRSN